MPNAVFLNVKVLKSNSCINTNPYVKAIIAKTKLKPILFFITINVY